MTLKTKKLILIAAVFGAWLLVDQVTKDWADTSLAHRYHPLPIPIGEAEAGKPLADVAKARFGWDQAELDAHIADFERLEPAGAYAPTDRPYATDGPAARARAFYIFWRDDRARPPRRIDKNDRMLVTQWSLLTLPDAPQDQVRRAADELVSSWTFADWLPLRFHKLDAEDAAALAPDRIHPISGGAGVRADQTVAAGEIYLLTSKRVDVMGEWFKLVYAENPNAAFGFMKGVPQNTRFLMFTILAMIALLVMAYIVYRLPAQGWFVRVAFAGIMAGAAGNLIDRLRFRYVIDFIDMDLGFMHWPTYNVADIGISVGVVALILNITFDKDSPLVSKKDKGKRAAKKGSKEAVAA